MTQVVALQTLPCAQESAYDTDLEKVSELSYFACGPFPSDLSSFVCV